MKSSTCFVELAIALYRLHRSLLKFSLIKIDHVKKLMWLINWIPGLLFIHFTDVLYAAFLGDSLCCTVKILISQVNSACSMGSEVTW